MIDLKAAHERRQAIAAMQAGRAREALTLATDLLRTNKNDRELLRVAAQSALLLGRFDESAKLFERYLALQPSDLYAMVDLARARGLSGHAADAQARYEKVLSLSPGFAPAITGLADLHERRHESADAERLLKPFVDAGTETAPMAVVYLRVLLGQGRYEEATALAHKQLKNSAIDDNLRHQICEKAAKAYEQLGRYDEAFNAFSQSNALRAQPFRDEEFIAWHDQVIRAFAPVNLTKLPRGRDRSELPVFIASMPRSGSTLVEQIIHAHPRAFGAGEIDDFQAMVQSLPNTLCSMWPYPACLGDLRQEHVDQLGRRYLNGLREYDRRAARIVNKHLDNYRVLGMVELLVPGARIVHVKRDPLDTCFSCFMAQIATNTFHWATDLRTIAIAYKQYERIMAHWRSVLSIPILDVEYEDLVEDPDTWIRRIIEFCGLPWDDRCLRYWEAERQVLTLSYDQVTKPIYKSSVKRWQKYEEFLGPLKEELARGDET